MNRIRAGYLELAPDLERFFVMGTYDDKASLNRTMGVEPGHSLIVQMVASTPMLVSVINSVLLAAILSLLTLQLGATVLPALAVGALGFIGGMAAQFWYGSRAIARGTANFRPMFPRPEAPSEPVE